MLAIAGKKRGMKGGPSLPWSVRYKVAVGIAEAIHYLHNGTERCVVHRDIKPSNILLSSKKTPKVRKSFTFMNYGFFIFLLLAFLGSVTKTFPMIFSAVRLWLGNMD